MGCDDDDGTGPPARRPARDEVERLLVERGEHLMRAAIALTGSRSDGEDLLQGALERLLRHWGRIEGDAEAYLRRMLYNMAADGWRRRGAWLRKLPLVHAGSGHAPGTAAVDAVDLRDALGRALAQLPPRQRAVLVLRYWEELSQAETADLLGCPEGTVKSAAARGLQRLRAPRVAASPPGGSEPVKISPRRRDAWSLCILGCRQCLVMRLPGGRTSRKRLSGALSNRSSRRGGRRR